MGHVQICATGATNEKIRVLFDSNRQVTALLILAVG